MAIAKIVKGTSVVWSRRERDKSLARMQMWRKAQGKAKNTGNYTKEQIISIADAAAEIDWVNRDPNFLYHEREDPTKSEVNINPWCNVLKNMQRYYSTQNGCSLTDAATGIFHVDIHGKQNDDSSDLDLGLHCIAYDIDKRQRLREALAFEFKKIFRDTEFTINAYPSHFGGNWGMHFRQEADNNDKESKRSRVKRIVDEGVHPSRLTLASFSATLNMYSVQLELSKRLRDHLIRNQLLLTKFGDAVEFVYRNITSEADRSKAFAAHSRRSPTNGGGSRQRKNPKVVDVTRTRSVKK